MTTTLAPPPVVLGSHEHDLVIGQVNDEPAPRVSRLAGARVAPLSREAR